MTKSHFQKVAALWMFSWELSATSDGSSTFEKLYFKVATLNQALQLFRFITALTFSCVQRNRGITVFFFTMECKSYSKLIIYPILPTGNYAAHFCFLKTVRFQKKFAQNICETRNSPYSLRERNFVFFKVQLDFIRFLESSLRFSIPTQLDFCKMIIYYSYSLYHNTTCYSIIFSTYCHIAFLQLF